MSDALALSRLRVRRRRKLPPERLIFLVARCVLGFGYLLMIAIRVAQGEYVYLVNGLVWIWLFRGFHQDLMREVDSEHPQPVMKRDWMILAGLAVWLVYSVLVYGL